MTWFLLGMYGLFAFISGLNLLLMRRPPASGERARVCVLIPARDESENLRVLIPALREPNPELDIYVFDDESADGTGDVASSLGAKVVRPRESLPPGWTGKNRACHELAKAASEDSDTEWLLFLDADVRPSPDFIPAIERLAHARPRAGVLTGFPQILSGEGIEPLFLAWVGWILLSTNPFGLVSRTGRGHNRFTNGQIHAWRTDVYTRLWPNEAVRSHILEDVMMGRLCAREGVQVQVANLSAVLSVRMYRTWRETLDGMSKNSYEITGSLAGTAFLAALLLLIAWGWVLTGSALPIALGLLILSGVFCASTARAWSWGLVALPVALSLGGYTLIRSAIWHTRGVVTWKGRQYDQRPDKRL